MYLKKIEVNGFKSFANKMVFEFGNGITGIVGPNGSGKSNIADAVRWVLGEQSAKQLRGSNMQDVIFAGTEMRKPVSYAAVSLTIDNSDHELDIEYDEVTVTRRVFRSGESEYLMNGTSCRLKDINELFYDTGIGKEGYSIIGQGQIDRILSGKPDERRELFDEAAGIVKFKRRKNQAVKSLENESNNLIRIDDILAELEKQVGPLSRQSEKAKDYLLLKENLKKYEVNLFLIETESMKAALERVSEKLDIVNHQHAEASAKFAAIKENYDAQDLLLQETSSKLEALLEKNNKGLLDKARLEQQIGILEEQIRSVNKTDETYRERIASIEAQMAERKTEVDTIDQSKAAIQEEANQALEKKQTADAAVAETSSKIEELTNDVSAKNARMMAGLNEKATIRSSMERNATLREQIQIRKAELTRRILDFKTDVSEYDEAIKRFQKELDDVSERLSKLTKENASLEEQILTTRKERTASREALNKARENSMRAKSKLETLRNIAERYDGYGNSIRKVMDRKSEVHGILGVVADLIKTDKKYEIAIETSLGGAIQHIVTDTQETAKELIQYLKKNQFGRATFLPLDAITVKDQKDEDVLKERGVLGYASDLVDTEKRYAELAEYLLNKAIVVDHIDNAIALDRKFGHSLKIVTLEGELLNPGGAMSGGAFKNQSNLLGRRREIEDLEAVIAKAKATIAEIEAQIAKQDDDIRNANEQLGNNQDALQELLLQRNTAQMNYNQVAEKKTELNVIFENNHKEEADIDAQLVRIKEQTDADQSKLVALDDEHERLTTEVQDENVQIEQLKTSLVELSAHAQEENIAYSKVSQKADYAEESRQRVLRELERLKESMDDLQEGKSENENEVVKKNEQIEQIRNTITFAEGELSNYDSEIGTLRTKKEELTESMKDFFQSRENCQAEVVTLEKEQFRLSQEKDRLEVGRDSRIDYMWEEYEITYSQALAMKDDDLIENGNIKVKVSEIKGQIKQLGPVNVNAIEEYKEVSERYEFLKKQHDDLVEGRDKLISVIEELDTGMREKFKEKFEEIREEYDKVFKQLFGGGKGALEIDPDVDILEADISIISQPPGKKLQNMMQLSGGEKALSAICLLFAIQNLKPSPFCLLDEIEAALDDSNVDRYAKYLHKLTKHTQFIVITHRRGTMASADRLYGITMQEKGVSTLVSVDLIRDELDEPQKK